MAFPLKFLRLALLLFLAPALWAQSLPERIEAFLRNPRFDACRWGIHVVSLDSGKVLVDHDGGKYFVPGSNAKLFTCAMALRRLGPDGTIRTSVLAERRPGPDGVLKGDLVLYGRGDPMLMGRGHGGPYQADPLEDLAWQVRSAGVQVIEGDVVGDDSHFATRPWGSGWEAGDRDFAFGTDVSALSIHDNMVELRIYPGTAPGRPCFLYPIPGKGLLPLLNLTTTDPGLGLRAQWRDGVLVVEGGLAPGAAPASLNVPVREPALFAARLLRRALERRGITVRGGARAVHCLGPTPAPEPAGRVELAHLDSLPVRQLVRATLKDSVNLYAQLLLLQAGGTESAGLAYLTAFLKAAGVQGALLEEGAGLSRKDLVRPEAVTALLAYMRTQYEGAAFEEALPLAGVDGTLRGRMGGTAATAQLRAKTGTMRYNHALSGYVTTSNGDHLAFSILLDNQVAPEGAPAQGDVDAIAVLLAQSGPF